MTTLSQVDWAAAGGAAYEALAKQYDTPYFLYDADAMTARVRAVRELLEGEAEIFYAVKSNPNLALLRSLRESAAGLDISSGGELEQALVAGYDADRLSFAGPAKSVAELRRSIETGV
ncbi:MAG: hypothetical protein AAFX85_06985, partial [Pseudomonadota bacterium]